MSYMVNPGVFAGVIELARDTTFYQESASSKTSWTSDSRAIGPASATRRVYALVYGTVASTSTRTLSSATIGGVSATIHAQVDYFPVNPGPALVAAIISAAVPTGTTAAVAVTFSGAMQHFACAVIALDRLNSGTAFDTATGTATSSAVSTGGALDYSSGGYAMAIAASTASDGTAPACTWTNLTESADTIDDPASGLTRAYSIAYQIGTPTSSNNNITATYTDTNLDKILVAISVR